MGNRFISSFNQPQQTGPFNNMQDMANQFNECRSNPSQFLANRGINVPPEYANNPQMMAQYLLNNMPASKQNGIFRAASMIKQMLGLR